MTLKVVCLNLSVIRERTFRKNFLLKMKRTYSRLSSEILRFDTEVGFMSCSVRVATGYEVEEYHDFYFEGSDGTLYKEHEITFGE